MKTKSFLWLFILLLPGIVSAVTIRGTITNGTTGDPGTPDRVVLKMPGEHEMEVHETIESPPGEFTFTDLSLRGVYLIQADYQGVKYNLNIRPAGEEVIKANLTIYESTPNWEDVTVMIPHFIVGSVDGERLRIDRTFGITNNSLKTIHEPGKGTFVFALPASIALNDPHHPVSLTATTEGEMPLRLPLKPLSPPVATLNELADASSTTEVSGLEGLESGTIEISGLATIDFPFSITETEQYRLYGIQFPLKPGRTEVNVVYDVPYTDNAYQMIDFYPYPLAESNLFVVPQDIKVESNQVRFEREDAERHFAFYVISALPANSTLKIHFSGGSFEELQEATAAEHDHSTQRGEIVRRPNIISENRIRIPVILTGLGLLFMMLLFQISHHPPLNVGSVPSENSRKALERQREALLNAMARADDEFAAGQLNKQDYQKRRTDLKNRLIHVLKEMENTLD